MLTRGRRTVQICSFLPSATEILYALDLGDSIAGVTFECDYPPQARQKPIVVNTILNHELSPAEIDRDVTKYASHGDSLYTVDTEMLKRIKPELIVTQELCDVCAVSTSHLAKALHAVSPQPEVLSLTPHTLPDVFRDIEAVGAATGKQDRAAELVASLKQRIARLQAKPKLKSKVACLEWLNPLFNAGHWVPEMVELAGGIDRLGIRGEYSVRIEWQQIFDLDPNVIVIMPCGYDVEKAVQEYRQTKFPPEWRDIQAVQNGRVYAVHASAYFSRPGPRLVDGVEILYSLLHQDFSSSLPAGSWAQI
jgi:iron complex transport system substrate-binding protein